MYSVNRFAACPVASELERVVEPLAAYICATEQPKSALMSALAVLLREVEATNRAALVHFRGMSAN
jgi:hypothetical protein